MSRVSIIIATYNCKDYINETIASVFSQTYRDYEVIIVDDDSIDGTREILKKLEGPKARLIFLEKNLGPSEARNEGMRLAKGEYIAILDHDDIWLPEKLEKQLSLFENDREIGLVFSDCMLIDKLSNPISGNKRTLFGYVGPKRGRVFQELIVNNFIPTSSVIFKQEVLKDIGFFDQRYFITQDFDYYLKISKKYKIDYIKEPLVKHRWLVGARSSNLETTLKEAIELTVKHAGCTKVSFFCAIAIRKSLMGYYKELGFYHLKNKQYRYSQKNFLKAIREYPFNPMVFYGLCRSLSMDIISKMRPPC